MELHRKEGFYKRQVENTYEITLRTGKKIRLTPEHPLLSLKGWVPASNLGIGSRIATPRTQPVFGDEDLSEEKVKILAYLLAEGHLGNNVVLFTNSDNKIMTDYCQSVKMFDKSLVIRNHGNYSVSVRCLKQSKILKSSPRDSKGRFTGSLEHEKIHSLKNWLKKIGIYEKKAHEKEIPDEIFKLPRNKLSIFLNRLFSCDGSIHNKGTWRVSYASSSEKLAFQVQHLLSRFGVVSKIRKKQTKHKDAYELIISGEFVKTFLSEIGFYGNKEKRQTIALKEALTIKRNPNLDTIPKEFWENYKPDNWSDLGRHLGYKYTKSARESLRYGVSRQKLLQIAEYEQSEEMILLAQSDIFWDEIIEMRRIEEPVTVYDITVPDCHNFVANDIIVHNSYTMGVIAEGVSDLPPEVKQNIAVVLVDTMGVYWTMKYQNKQDKELLEEWNLDSKALDVKIFTPVLYHDEFKEKGIPTDKSFSIKPSELSGQDWNTTFSIKEDDAVGVLIERAIYDLRESGKEFSIKDIVKKLDSDKESEPHIRAAAKNRFLNAADWGLFSDKGTKIEDLIIPGQITVLDISCYATMPGSWNIKNMVVGLIAQKLFVQRMIARKEEEYKEVHKSVNPYTDEEVSKQEVPLVWLVLDEAHEFLPSEGKTLATDPLVTILREGRQPGISLILASQQPGKIHTDVLTQADTVIAHRITAKLDTDALGTLMQSYMRKGLVEELDNLPREKGSAIIFDDTNEKMYPIRVRPRFTWHGGGAPSAIHGNNK